MDTIQIKGESVKQYIYTGIKLYSSLLFVLDKAFLILLFFHNGFNWVSLLELLQFMILLLLLVCLHLPDVQLHFLHGAFQNISTPDCATRIR